MTDLTEAKMPEEENGTHYKKRILTLIFAEIGILFCAGAAIAVIKAYFRGVWQSNPLIGIGILIALIAAIAGLGYLAYKVIVDHRNQTGPLSKKERLNRNILIGCGVLGTIVGFAMANLGSDAGYIFSDAKIPTIVALGLAAIFGIFLPIISLIWHRNIDEQEAHAYKEGAFYALCFYAIAAPVWWILWRGGLVPEPNGVIIYYLTLFIVGLVWVKKKYY